MLLSIAHDRQGSMREMIERVGQLIVFFRYGRGSDERLLSMGVRLSLSLIGLSLELLLMRRVLLSLSLCLSGHLGLILLLLMNGHGTWSIGHMRLGGMLWRCRSLLRWRFDRIRASGFIRLRWRLRSDGSRRRKRTRRNGAKGIDGITLGKLRERIVADRFAFPAGRSGRAGRKIGFDAPVNEGKLRIVCPTDAVAFAEPSEMSIARGIDGVAIRIYSFRRQVAPTESGLCGLLTSLGPLSVGYCACSLQSTGCKKNHVHAHRRS